MFAGKRRKALLIKGHLISVLLVPEGGIALYLGLYVITTVPSTTGWWQLFVKASGGSCDSLWMLSAAAS